MTARTPLIFDSTVGNPRRMTDDEIALSVSYCVFAYAGNPSVTLTVASGIAGGTLSSSFTDTRLSAGAVSTSTTAFPNESTTQEPQTVTVTYQRMTQANADITPASDSGRLFPVYLTSGGNIQAMNQTDMNDTFLHPAIDKLVSSFSDRENQGGTYTVGTSTTLSNCTLVSSNPIFTDTRADVDAYTSGGIPETQDQPTTIQNYFLFQIDQGTEPNLTQNNGCPLFINSDGNLQSFLLSDWQTILTDQIRETASESTNTHQISYNVNGSGTNRGSAMANTILDGSGNYQTRQVSDDYRAQEFPNGSATTAATHNFKITKA
tara:strand:+ start:423 stop:1382 length:960 start_codon:yes stop_codon:yes gene_type:complete